MARPSFPSLLLLGLAALSGTATVQAAEFDPALNGLRLRSDAASLRTWDFETAEGLVGAALTKWTTASGVLGIQPSPITSADQVAARITNGADAIEGAHALRLDRMTGLSITDPSLFAQVKDGRFEVSLWARDDGMSPMIQVVYDADPEKVHAVNGQFAIVRAIRTGRETTDGWAELSTGPLDGSVWGVPARGIAILPPTKAESALLVDALEVRAVKGKPTAPVACTQSNVDTVCGAEGDCMYGHCVSSTITWGADLPPAHRAQIAERWITIGTHFLGNRGAAQNAATAFAPRARALVGEARSSRQFLGGLNRLVNLLRDHHTTFGAKSTGVFSPQPLRPGSSSVLGACFGVVDKDIMSSARGDLGFAVFGAVDKPPTGTQLRRGDVLVAIDGMDPKRWVDEFWPGFATHLPSDPRSDWSFVASDLSSLLYHRASSITLERCASATSCGANARTRLTIPIGDVAFRSITSTTSTEAPIAGEIGCSPRFSESVTTMPAPSGGEDPIGTSVGPNGELRVQFDGFRGAATWRSTMTDIFSARPARVVMDTREGHGGTYQTVQYLLDLLRGTNEPMGVWSAGRVVYGLLDPPWIVSRFSDCAGTGATDWMTCVVGRSNGFFTRSSSPPSATGKIAWLDACDVSANDFMPRLLKGRTGVRIFGPHPTSGAFGSILELPPMVPGRIGASFQIQDARFAPSAAELETARWESGHGVEPDVIVVQKLSDALAGIDTILTAATAWLAE